MNGPTHTRTNQHVIRARPLLVVVLMLTLSVAACGSNHEPSSDTTLEFGAASTHEVATDEESPANYVVKAILGGLLAGIWLVACIFLGSWWSLLIVPVGTFCWVLQRRFEYYGFRDAASHGFIWSILTVAATLVTILLCWIF